MPVKSGSVKERGNMSEMDYSSLMSEVGSVPISAEKQNRLLHNKNGFKVVSSLSGAPDRQFSQQYAHSYSIRLGSLRPRLEKKVKEQWQSGKLSLKKIAELCEATKSLDKPRTSLSPVKKGSPTKARNTHEQRVAFQEDIIVAIIGTIFKQQPEKPSILQELSEENPMVPVAPKEKYISDKDYLLLEDETTQVRLVTTPGCGIYVDKIVNGVVCAVKGRPTIDGKFEVHEVIWPSPEAPIWPEMKLPMEVEMVFVSGLHLGKAVSPKNAVFVDLLFDYLGGLAGSISEQQHEISNQSRVFFLGNLLWKSNNLFTESLNEEMITSAKKLDSMLNDLAKTMEVFVVPGKNDPGETMMPQPPIHRCIVPKASKLKTFHSLGNPSRISLGFSSNENFEFMFSSGENVTDAIRNSSIESPLEMAQSLLQWGHVCPTAPDTLPLHPGCSDDAFIIEGSLPHFFVVGNQKSFGVSEWEKTRIVSIPDFSETGTAVILTKDLKFIPFNFQAL